MEAIRIWLNGKRNFDAGAKLYELYGDNKLLKKLFAERPVSKYKEDTLTNELQKLLSKKADVKEKAVIQEKKKIDRVQQEKQPDHGWSKNMDEVEAALHAQWKPLFAEMMDRCSRMEDLAIAGRTNKQKKAESCRNVLRILRLEKMCDDLYEQRDNYKADGTLPVKKDEGEFCIDPLLMPLKLQNAQKYVRDNKAKLRNDPSNIHAAEQIKKWQRHVDHYKKELNLV